MDNQIKYAIQLALLNRLSGSKLISEREYMIIKADMIKRYKVNGIMDS